MTGPEVAALEDRVCLAFEGLPQERAVERGRDGRVAYRCPFGHHWHAERLSIDELGEIARMMRERSAGPPAVVESL